MVTTRSKSIRITSSRQANDHIGDVCSFTSKGVLEYGRIVYVTPTSIRIERMTQTADGDFILHPNQKNSVTNNVITFTRKITIAIAATAATESSLLNTSTKSAKSAKSAETVVERRITRSCSRNQQLQQEQVQENAIKSKSGKPTVQETVQEKSPEKLTRDQRRRNEALLELKTLGKVSSLIVSGQRQRKRAEHQDAAFVLASLKQSKDAGKKGGLLRGSRHHYDRSY